RFDRMSTRVERAVVRRRSEGEKHLSIESIRRDVVADALLRVRHRGLDRPPQLLERGALVGAQGREVFVDVRWLRSHWDAPSDHTRSIFAKPFCTRQLDAVTIGPPDLVTNGTMR